MAEACRAFRICRQLGYMWWSRYQQRGMAGLQESSRRPRRSPHALWALLWIEPVHCLRRQQRRRVPNKLRV
jgi:hypothetical protein